MRRAAVGGLADLVGKVEERRTSARSLGCRPDAGTARGAASACATRSSPALRSTEAMRAWAYWT